MIGPSGAGKSTRAKEIAEKHKGSSVIVEIFSTDDLFNVNGVYKFDADKLYENHRKNRKMVEAAMVNYLDGEKDLIAKEIELASIWGEDPKVGHIVIVDNTNTKQRDRKPYEQLAEKYKYEVKHERFSTSKQDLVKYAARNLHGLTLDQVMRQAAKIDIEANPTTEK